MRRGTCERCGEAICWRRTPAGRWQPVNADDGEVHFPRCRERVAAERERVRQWYAQMDGLAGEGVRC